MSKFSFLQISGSEVDQQLDDLFKSCQNNKLLNDFKFIDKEVEKEDTRLERKDTDEERNKRTVFVGNVTNLVLKDKSICSAFKSLFKEGIGSVESIRFRSIAFDKPTVNSLRRIKRIRKEFHPEKDTLNAYVVYNDLESINHALDLNSTLFQGHYLRVDSLSGQKNVDNSVFLGNLPFNVTEDQIRDLFSSCGVIKNVRVVRDRKTSLGKGFGFVEFDTREEVQLALKFNDSEFLSRKIRVRKCGKKDIKKEKRKNPDFQGEKSKIKEKEKKIRKLKKILKKKK
jgi:nucleolar protein 12